MHLRGAVEVVVRAADPLLPADGLARGGIEIVAFVANRLPAGKGLAISIEIALQAVGTPRNPASLHDASAIEVIPATINLPRPTRRIAVGTEVIALAIDRLPIRLHQRPIVVNVLESVANGFETGHDGLGGLHGIGIRRFVRRITPITLGGLGIRANVRTIRNDIWNIGIV